MINQLALKMNRHNLFDTFFTPAQHICLFFALHNIAQKSRPGKYPNGHFLMV